VIGKNTAKIRETYAIGAEPRAGGREQRVAPRDHLGGVPERAPHQPELFPSQVFTAGIVLIGLEKMPVFAADPAAEGIHLARAPLPERGCLGQEVVQVAVIRRPFGQVVAAGPAGEIAKVLLGRGDLTGQALPRQVPGAWISLDQGGRPGSARGGGTLRPASDQVDLIGRHYGKCGQLVTVMHTKSQPNLPQG
jgi:hypothetical protein